MRTRTRNFVLALFAILVALLALGALPGLLKSGDPYYLTLAPVGEYNASNGTLEGTNQTALNVSDLPEQRFPYTTAALANASANATGQANPYWKGPVGLKEPFTHSPFDERESLARRNTSASTDDGVYVHDGDTVYLLTITQEKR